MGAFLSILNINSIINPDVVVKQMLVVDRKQGINKCWPNKVHDSNTLLQRILTSCNYICYVSVLATVSRI